MESSECFGPQDLLHFGDGSLGWLLAPIAFIVASMFIFSGILLTQGYRNGISTTIATFIISGSLSIIFTGETLNPVSVSLADGGMMIPFSMMCTLLGIGVAAIPLLLTDEELKTGWPPAIERLLNKQNPGKVEINCSHCGSPLLVPREIILEKYLVHSAESSQLCNQEPQLRQSSGLSGYMRWLPCW